jgi:oligoendopeptidase F
MTNPSTRLFATGLALASLALQAAAQERERDQIPDQFRWDLADVYPSAEAWRAAKDRVAAGLPRLAQYRGQLASSASTLADALDA